MNIIFGVWIIADFSTEASWAHETNLRNNKNVQRTLEVTMLPFDLYDRLPLELLI